MWPLSAVLGPVSALPTAPGMARAFTVMTVGSWGLPDAGDLADAARAVVSELCGNVVDAATGDDGEPLYRDGRLARLRVGLYSDRYLLRAEVWDDLPRAAGVPVLRRPGPDDESGRGLALVAALSNSWGWHPVPGRPLKCVWALLTVQPGHEVMAVYPPGTGHPQLSGETPRREQSDERKAPDRGPAGAVSGADGGRARVHGLVARA